MKTPSPAIDFHKLLLQNHSSEEMKKSSMSKLLAQLLIEEINQNVDHSQSIFLRLISFLEKITSDNEQNLGTLENNIQSDINEVALQNIVNPNLSSEQKASSDSKQEEYNTVIPRETFENHEVPTLFYNEPSTKIYKETKNMKFNIFKDVVAVSEQKDVLKKDKTYLTRIQGLDSLRTNTKPLSR